MNDFEEDLYRNLLDPEFALAYGVEREQLRIIKLLEPLGCDANGIEHDCQNGLGYITAQDIIDLIREDGNG